jgi:hypothetical protein
MRQTFDRLIDFSTVAITAGYKAAKKNLAQTASTGENKPV